MPLEMSMILSWSVARSTPHENVPDEKQSGINAIAKRLPADMRTTDLNEQWQLLSARPR